MLKKLRLFVHFLLVIRCRYYEGMTQIWKIDRKRGNSTYIFPEIISSQTFFLGIVCYIYSVRVVSGTEERITFLLLFHKCCRMTKLYRSLWDKLRSNVDRLTTGFLLIILLTSTILISVFFIHTYIPITLYPRKASRGILDITPRSPRFTNLLS
jgi:hypothetical protein